MKKTTLILFIIVLLTTFMLICSCNNTPMEIDEENKPITPATIDILKIGKADCIVINTGSKIVMIDTGEEENLDTINSYMSSKNYSQIDMLILTHYDKDHIGGASEIISNYNVTTVIESKFDDSTMEYISYHNVLYNKKLTPIKLNVNYTFTYDSCEFEINIPKKNKYETKQDNNSSLIISMKCGENRFLFCGDAMEERLAEFIEYNQNNYDFVKLPYHGNYLENYREFLNSVKAKYGALTNSKKNPASEDTLLVLNEFNVDTYQTRYGTIYITTNGKQISITQK